MKFFGLQKNYIVLIFILLFAVLSWHPKNNNLTKHNSLRTDYAKVVVTWEPPNNAPTFSAGPAENPASTVASPTNSGTNVTFNATGTDPDGDNYYLAICRANSIQANNNAAPTCNGANGAWCVSGSTVSGAQASCATTTADWMDGTSNAWYGFVCDYDASSACSSVSQGSGDSGSPFVVNHKPVDPTCGSWPGYAVNPGSTYSFGATIMGSDSDGDAVNMYACKTSNTSGAGCETSQEWCHTNSCGTDCQCDATSPLPGEGNYSYYIFSFDEHGFRSSTYCNNGSMSVNNVAPVVSNVTVNGGSSIDLSTGGEGTAGNKNIDVTADVTDNNGCADIVNVTTKAYPSGLGAGSCSSQNNNNCYYNVACTGGSCTSGITKAYTCTINFKYHADPTDASTPRALETWLATVSGIDESTPHSAESGAGVELLSYTSLDIASTINYGALGAGEMASTTALSTTTAVYASGNTAIDVNLSGTNMTSGANNILVGQQRYATSGVQYQNATALTGSATEFELNLKKTTTTATMSDKNIFWGLQVPGNVQAGSYSGVVTTTAVKAEVADW